jgi:serine protease Do
MSTRARRLPVPAIALAALIGVAGGALRATESEAATRALALRIEEELTNVIERSNAAFVFIGGGSGILVSSDGLVLTNHHVAGDRKQWAVRIWGRERLVVADLIGTDPVGDLALLRIHDAKDLPYLEFGDIAKMRVGQQVLCTGDPFKLAEMDGPPSVSLGTVSALHRYQGNYSDAIQTDCAINPGNSGGPMLTLEGKLIGITGQIISRFGAKANTGIAYAIPVDQILRFMPLLRDANGGIVYHGTLPEGLTFINRVDDAQAATVEKVEPKSAGDKAGFRAGDRVLSVDGKAVYNYARFTGLIRSYPEQTHVSIVVQRGQDPVKLDVTLPRLALTPVITYVAPLGARLQLGSGAEGVRVTQVDRNSVAERAGLQAGDIILTINNHPPTPENQDLLFGRNATTLELRVQRSSSGGISQKSVTVQLGK